MHSIVVGRDAMACRFEVVFNAGETADATELGVAALDLVDLIEDRITVYRDGSELMRLNATASEGWQPVAADLFELLVMARQLSERTGGGFDCASGALVRAWGFLERRGRIPTDEALQAARERSGMRLVELDLATQTAQAVAAYRTSQRLVAWYEEYILPKARETVSLTQTLYARGEVTFLSLLQAQRILTETELAYVDSQAERWTGAVSIADLLQLEMFPPPADAPAVIGMGESNSELNRLKQDDLLKKRPEPVPPVAPAAVAPRADMEPLQMPPPVARPIDPLRPVAP